MAFNGQPAESAGGDGGYGFVRLEDENVVGTGALGNVAGPPLGSDNFGLLRDRDSWTGMRSTWYPSPGVNGEPHWRNYVLRATVGGAPVVYSDLASIYNPAFGIGVPIQLYVQTAWIDAQGNPKSAPGPWRRFVGDDGPLPGLNADRGNGFRFLVLFDRSVTRDLTLTGLSLSYRD